MTTKADQIVNPYSRWNQTANDEPVLIIPAEKWRLVLAMALASSDKGGGFTCEELFYQAMRMKTYSDDNTIPF